MKRILTILLLGVLTTFMVQAASAATYYVANSGNDSWPGTSSQPWVTLQHAVDTIAAGDTIIVKPGEYVGCRIRSSGTAGAPKTLMSEVLHGAAVTSKGPLNRKDCNIELDADNYTDPNSYWIVDGFEIRNSLVAGVKALLAPYLIFRNNWCHHNGSGGAGHDGFYGIAPYGLFENNEFSFNAEHGLYVGQGCMEYAVIRDNVAHDNNNMGFHNNGDKGAPFDTDGMLDYWIIERNISYNNATSHGIDADGMRFSTLRNNLVYNIGNSGIMFLAMGGAEVSHDNRVLNNTVLSQNNWVFQVYRRGGPNNKLFNNVLYCSNSSYGSICLGSTLAQSGFESDYNVVNNKFKIGSSNYTLAQWQALGYDLHSFIATPSELFVDPANGDYHLKVGSPAINAGTTLTDVTDDLEGTSRPQGAAYDIGCYEAGSGPPPDLVITTTSLAGGTVGIAYSQTVQATGGVQPYTWSIISGSLPSGLNLNSSTGVISGTPTASGTSNFTVRVADSQQPADTYSKALSITVNAAPPAPTITTTSLPNGQRQVAYSAFVQATGGTLPYTWSKTSGSFPQGLSLNSSTGEISGTPKKTGTSNFTIRCTDAMSQYDEKALSITIN